MCLYRSTGLGRGGRIYSFGRGGRGYKLRTLMYGMDGCVGVYVIMVWKLYESGNIMTINKAGSNIHVFACATSMDVPDVSIAFGRVNS